MPHVSRQDASHVGLYLLTTTGLLSFVGAEGLANADDFGVLGAQVLGSAIAGRFIILLVVFLASVASVQATILFTARTTFGMARRNALPFGLARTNAANSPSVVASSWPPFSESNRCSILDGVYRGPSRTLERAPGMLVPESYRPPAKPTPVIVWASWAWRPGLLLGWKRDLDGVTWCCHIRYRLRRHNADQFVVFDPQLILPVTIDDGLQWWMPDLPE